MFRKIFRHLFIFFVLITVLLWFPRSILPIQIQDTGNEGLEDYIRLNENENRLLEFKDSEEALRLKLIQLALINKSRDKKNAPPVELDILASRVANKMCSESAQYEYVGHWNMNGEKPYHRYAFAGGYDHVSENAFGEWSSVNYENTSSNISALMQSGHESFMAERAPNDGHKQNILDKAHNFVGIGFYLKAKQFRYYEEFIDRYFEFENIPSEVKAGKQTSITVKTDGAHFLYFMIIYHEKVPQKMTVEQLKRKGSYEDYTNEIYLQQPAWELSKYKNGSSYNIPLSFSKEGLYYIHLYYDTREITKAASLNTKGKTPASGIVIKVSR